ncbi:MAG: 50S ribosome-binding GTPase [Solirubrobacteraceae bacterium]|nr:50S ribosome-binding GTPase [Solirubrobacteraceae bacterium]
MATATATTLRLATAGSVDDGKSTLIGRLLYDAKSVLQDQMDQVAEASKRRNANGEIDLSLLTDGLRAEREQGITIDVAYRYFATARRRFILADCPGHVQYTRNMLTGASTADLAIVLVDARHGVVEQTRRHAFIASLLGIRHLVLAVNKMDLVDFSEERFDEISRDFCEFARGLKGVREVTYIPIGAKHGDNVVHVSENTPWYGGLPLLEHLETVEVTGEHDDGHARFPVQWVIRDPETGEREYAGQVAGGTLKAGDEVVVLPGGVRTTVAEVRTIDGPLDEAFAPLSVTVKLTDDVDVARGDMLCGAEETPEPVRELEADVCWMADAPLRPRGKYALKLGTQSVRVVVDELIDVLDVHTLDRHPAPVELAANDIGRVRLRVSRPIVADAYEDNRATGALILIDEATNDTVAAGMAVGT